MIRKIVVGLLIVLVVIAIGSLVWEPLAARAGVAPPARAYDGRIVRDEWGVPHLFGRTDADAVFALAYAHAEDDFDTLEQVVAMTRGRAGALTGQDGAKVDYALALLDVRATVDREMPRVPADVRGLLDAYAAGLNRYAARHPGEVKLSRLFPVDAKDVAAGFVLRSPFFFGLDDTLGPLVGNKPLGRESAGPMVVPAIGARIAASLIPDSMSGSNAFAVASKRTGDGHTRLISNSHQPWNGGVAWYEVSVHSQTGWDFAGATFPGGFVPFLGHNRTLGWTNTVNRPDMIDVYKLVLDERGENYRFDGKWLPLTSKRVWLRVKVGPFTLPVPRTVHASVHGPVIMNDSGAYAIHYGGMGTMGMLEQYYRITKVRNWDEWSRAMSQHAIPATNFIYADASGKVAMVYNGQFPQRKPGADYRGLLPGDTSRNLASGSVPWSQIPQNVDPKSGFVQNANNTPFLASGQGSELDPARYSPLLGIERDTTNRGVRATRLLERSPKLGWDELLRIKFDTAYERDGYAGRWMKALVDARVEPGSDNERAQALLRGWDWTLDGRGSADALAVLVLRPGNRWNYKREAKMPNPATELTAAVEHLTKHFGRIDPPLGDLLRVRRGTVDVPMDGGPDVLRAAALWDVEPDGRLRVRHGDSFVMLIDWDPQGRVTSRSIQPFGSATTRPNSKHYADQTPLFVAHKFKPVHFERADLLRHAVRAYRP